MVSCKEKALEWNLSPRAINQMCKNGKIKGAVKEKGKWIIPRSAKKPLDGRTREGKNGSNLKPLPLGISDYIRAQAEYYYVDKTLLLKDFLDQKPLISLFTRPRRFGKTLNMDMIRVFFEKTDEDTSKYFEDKKIWKCGKEYQKYQGQYPVIFLSFKDVKFNSWEDTLDKIKGLISEEYGRHKELEDSTKLSVYDKEYYKRVVNTSVGIAESSSSLERLSKMLTTHHGTAPVIIIDEYDTPIQEGYSKDFYDEIIGFMRNLFSGAFKDNKNISFGFLTGILRISQESIFSGLNNLTVYSVLDEEYDRFFGFTYEEVKTMLAYYGISEREKELKEWYNGYIFGKEEIYNPWSVINYIYRRCIPQAYWVNTSNNEVLCDVLSTASDDTKEKIFALLKGENVIARIDQNLVYRLLPEDQSNVFSLLLTTGYLKTTKKELQSDGTYLCEVAIPNREISSLYKNEILSHLYKTGFVSRSTANKIAESLFLGNCDKLQSALSEYLKSSVSFHDGGAEVFYHGLVLGLIALLDNAYKIKSNRESGYGRYDISMIPRESRYPGIIFEIKWQRDADEKQLDALSEKALSQIILSGYETEQKDNNVSPILLFGIAFSGKKVRVKTLRA